MSNPQLAEAINNYFVPKPEGDIDLIAEVRQCLMSSGLGLNISHYDNSRLIQEGIGKISGIQRFQLNRFWHMQLMSCSDNSSEERYCLIPNGEVSDWFKLFKAKVMPFIIKNQLPKGI